MKHRHDVHHAKHGGGHHGHHGHHDGHHGHHDDGHHGHHDGDHDGPHHHRARGGRAGFPGHYNKSYPTGGSESKKPAHITKRGDGRYGPVEHDQGESEEGQGTGYVHGHTGVKGGIKPSMPRIIAGNKSVLKAAEEKKSIGEVPGIYGKKRLDRKVRPGGISGS